MFKWLRNIGGRVGREAWDVSKQATGEALGKGAHEAMKIVVEKITRDPHGELLADIKTLLAREDRQLILERLLKHSAEHRENRTANLLIKIPKEHRKEILEWFCWLGDRQADQLLDLLENNKFEEFAARFSAMVKKIVYSTDPQTPGLYQRLDSKLDQVLTPVNKRVKKARNQLAKKIKAERKGRKRWTSLWSF